MAGLHFPTDTQAGQKLGVSIAQAHHRRGKADRFELMALLQQ